MAEFPPLSNPLRNRELLETFDTATNLSQIISRWVPELISNHTDSRTYEDILDERELAASKEGDILDYEFEFIEGNQNKLKVYRRSPIDSEYVYKEVYDRDGRLVECENRKSKHSIKIDYWPGTGFPQSMDFTYYSYYTPTEQYIGDRHSLKCGYEWIDGKGYVHSSIRKIVSLYYGHDGDRQGWLPLSDDMAFYRDGKIEELHFEVI